MIQEFDVKKWNGKPIYIYGAGQDGVKIAIGLNLLGINQYSFIDQRKNLETEHAVKTIDSLCVDDEINVILGSSRYFNEMYDALNSRGFLSKINLYVAGCDLFLMESDYMNHKLHDVFSAFSYMELVQQLYVHADSNKWYIHHLDVIITEICTLKCEACGSLMPLYEKPQNKCPEIIFESFENLIKSGCQIGTVCLIGGEPLVNQRLITDFLNRYGDSSQIGIFQIITNGTLIPSEELLSVMRDIKKCYFIFSNYGNLSRKQDEALTVIEEYMVFAGVESDEDITLENGTMWIDYGEVKKYNFTDEYVKNMYDNCMDGKYCTTMINGKLCICPRIAHGLNLGLIPEEDMGGNYVSLLDKDIARMSKDAVKQKCLNLLHTKTYPSGCEYCNRNSGILVERAKQVCK